MREIERPEFSAPQERGSPMFSMTKGRTGRVFMHCKFDKLNQVTAWAKGATNLEI